MLRVCLVKNTGRLIEMQSGGYEDPERRDDQLAVLEKNAIQAGYVKGAIETKWVDEAEFGRIVEAQESTIKAKRKAVVEALITKKMRRLAVDALLKEGALVELNGELSVPA